MFRTSSRKWNLSIRKQKVHHDEWCERMKKDVNWKGVDCLSVEDLWTICQYVVYTAMAYPRDRHKGEWVKDPSQSNEFIDWFKCSNCELFKDCESTSNYCPNCGAQMYES